MPPTTSRDFLKIASQKLIVANYLFDGRYTLDAQYLGGYTIECSLKAVIMHFTRDDQKSETLIRITKGFSMHLPDTLFGELARLLKQSDPPTMLPDNLKEKIRQYGWTTGLRYETGRRETGWTRSFLRLAEAILNWAKGQIHEQGHPTAAAVDADRRDTIN